MNIYGKLQKVKVEILDKNITQTGRNAYANYSYFELSDFLNPIIQSTAKNNLSTHISFNKDLATLTITNIDEPTEQIIITSPMSTANLKGCHEVQNLGAVQTYLRRYLYMAAFDITDSDQVEPLTGNITKAKTFTEADMPEEQIAKQDKDLSKMSKASLKGLLNAPSMAQYHEEARMRLDEMGEAV